MQTVAEQCCPIILYLSLVHCYQKSEASTTIIVVEVEACTLQVVKNVVRCLDRWLKPLYPY